MQFKTLVLIPFLALARCGSGAPTAFAYHDNAVTVARHGSVDIVVTAMSYVVLEHSVTSGQDPDSHVTDGMQTGGWDDTAQSGNMTFTVGRSGSSTVASWWASRVSSSQSTYGKEPGLLNFAFRGTLTFTAFINGADSDTYTLQNTYFAQGHTGTSNDWWFGGPSCTKIDGVDQVSCPAVDSKGHSWSFTFSRGSDGGEDVSTVAIENVES